MDRNSSNKVSDQMLLPRFGPNFLEDHARRIITDPKIALIELVANCWDAGADRVDIVWPEQSVPDLIKIKDNGTGMTYDQFIRRWRELNYNRRKSQGEDVIFPSGNRGSRRKAFGRNGKGRHSMFCFANQYTVETFRHGEANQFRVERTDDIAKIPYRIEHVRKFKKSGHGTCISTTLGRNYLGPETVRDLIGSKFITDPAFEVYLNDEIVGLTDLEHLIDVQTVVIAGLGEVTVSQVDTQETSRTSHPHGVAWWVNQRLVGEPSWDKFGGDGFLDKRTIKAKRYTFIVEANILADDVREDWSDFRDTQNYRDVHAAVEEHIRRRILELMQDVHKEKKREAIRYNSEYLRNLPTDSRYYVGRAVDQLQTTMPSLPQNILTDTVTVLTNLEKTRSGYSLLEQLAKLNPDDLERLNEILSEWSVREARLVLGELERRLKVIQRLEDLVDDPTSDELHEIQPLFERGLWIFGPEYESVHFTSNRTLLTVIRELLDDDLVVPLVNPRRRPDFVALPDSTVGIYASDFFDERGEVDGIDKVLIVELKRGGSKIGLEEKHQGEIYAMELRRSGKVRKSTKIKVFVLGAEVEHIEGEESTIGQTEICPRSYNVVIRKAHARTFHLLEKIKKIKSDELFDRDVEEILKPTLNLEMPSILH
jgi:hypothetical protein